MELKEAILSKENLNNAYKKIVSNKGAGGVDGVEVEELGEWLHHKIRVIVMKQWKIPKTIYRNLWYLNRKNKNGFDNEAIYKVANSRLSWYRRSGMNVVNFIIRKDLLENRIKDGAGLLNPLSYYLSNVGI